MTVENELNKLNYDCLVLSEEVTDSTGTYNIRLLFVLNMKTDILVKNLESNELEIIPYNSKDLTVKKRVG